MEYYPWWSESQRKLADEAKAVTDELLIPLSERSAWKKEFPWEELKEMARRGWFGALIPVKYGGRLEEWGVTGACILLEEIGRATYKGLDRAYAPEHYKHIPTWVNQKDMF